ncbi:MAG: NAD(P)/FAD-dependent oxidoreductase [Candidatus Taylorbacteria bacterium]
MKSVEDTLWDVLVIGGGPAGMMAAGRASERRDAAGRCASVLLIEKNATLGKKLLITGGGRCNVTNAEFDTRTLLARFNKSDKFLFSAFSQWAVPETLDFFHMREMQTKIEAEQRVFPITNKAESVWNVLVDYIKRGNVTVLSKSVVIGLIKKGNQIEGVVLKNKKMVRAKSVILATGGKSRPETGSTGEGFEWLKSVGHSVSEPEASLVPIAIKDMWVKKLAGTTLSDVKITVLQNEVKQAQKIGKILFTHVGLSGPTILNMSKDVGELLKYGEVTISLDLLPPLDYGEMNRKLQDVFKEHSNKKFKNSLSGLLSSRLAPVIVELSGISSDTPCNSVTREERLRLVKLLKHIPLSVKGLLGVEKAIVTSGGVSLDEVDFKTMSSRLFPNLYLVGDILNIDRPSGGYSLQLCWTTGYVAGNSVRV